MIDCSIVRSSKFFNLALKNLPPISDFVWLQLQIVLSLKASYGVISLVSVGR